MQEIKEAFLQFDLDGTVIDVVSEMCKSLNIKAREREMTVRFSLNDFTHYGWVKNACMTLGLPISEADHLMSLWHDPGFLYSAKPYPMAIPTLKLLDFIYKGKVNFATARYPRAKDLTYAWFEKHYPKPVREGRVHIRSLENKEKFEGGEDFKAFIALESGAKRVYEDKGETGLILGGKARLLDRPYNRNGAFRKLIRIHHNFLGVLAHELSRYLA